ncbi:hypothetical protein F-liban_199 [Faustovirus]|nr:hypothetical protein F-liban_199 [Faustovirus]SME64872.1 Putative Zinc-ribbon domain containing protein [Faustovirus ST1]
MNAQNGDKKRIVKPCEWVYEDGSNCKNGRMAYSHCYRHAIIKVESNTVDDVFKKEPRIKVKEGGSVADDPELKLRWHTVKNLEQLGKTAETTNINSNHPVWWICQQNHEFVLTPKVKKEWHGCPKCKVAGFSMVSLVWLDCIRKKYGIRIKDASWSKEHLVKYTTADGKQSHFEVDGFCEELGLVLEFNGSYYHSHPDYVKAKGFGELNYQGISHAEIYARTLERERIIRSQGYAMLIMWEHEWKEVRKNYIAGDFVLPMLEEMKRDKPAAFDIEYAIPGELVAKIQAERERIKNKPTRGTKVFKYTQKSVIDAFTRVHGINRYDYSKVVLNGAHTNVIVVCPRRHGEFKIDPTSHISGRGCKFCNNDQFTHVNDFQDKTMALNGKLMFTYETPNVPVEVVGETIINITCRDIEKHSNGQTHQFTLTYTNLKTNLEKQKTGGCNECNMYAQKHADRKKDTTLGKSELFQQKLINEWVVEVNGDANDYKLGTRDEVMWDCSKCRFRYFMKVSSRTRDKPIGCPKCFGKVRKGSRLSDHEVAKWVVDININPDETHIKIGQKIKLKCPNCDFNVDEYPCRFNCKCPNCKN